MKSIIEFLKTYSFLWLIIGIIIWMLLGGIFNRNNIKKLHESGNITITYVYDITGRGRARSFDANYYFYVNGVNFKGYCVKPQDFYPRNKFYIVYYNPENPKKSILDFNQEIPPDSVYKYFSQGKNPFESEIKQDSIKRLRGN